jgi:hypothetical protein
VAARDGPAGRPDAPPRGLRDRLEWARGRLGAGGAAAGDLTNTALGVAAQPNTTGLDNTAVGFAALFSDGTGSYNTAVGAHALSSVTGGDRTRRSG